MLKRTNDCIENAEEQPVNPETAIIRELDKASRKKRELEKKSFRPSGNFKSLPFILDAESPPIDHALKRSKRILHFQTNNDIERITNAISYTNLDSGSAPSHYTPPKP